MALKINTLKIRSTNNRLLFILGLVGVLASLLQRNSILWVVSWVITMTGLVNAATWADEKGWPTLNSDQRRSRVQAVLLITVSLVAAAGLFIFIASID